MTPDRSTAYCSNLVEKRILRTAVLAEAIHYGDGREGGSSRRASLTTLSQVSVWSLSFVHCAVSRSLRADSLESGPWASPDPLRGPARTASPLPRLPHSREPLALGRDRRVQECRRRPTRGSNSHMHALAQRSRVATENRVPNRDSRIGGGVREHPLRTDSDSHSW